MCRMGLSSGIWRLSGIPEGCLLIRFPPDPARMVPHPPEKLRKKNCQPDPGISEETGCRGFQRAEAQTQGSREAGDSRELPEAQTHEGLEAAGIRGLRSGDVQKPARLPAIPDGRPGGGSVHRTDGLPPPRNRQSFSDSPRPGLMQSGS